MQVCRTNIFYFNFINEPKFHIFNECALSWPLLLSMVTGICGYFKKKLIRFMSCIDDFQIILKQIILFAHAEQCFIQCILCICISVNDSEVLWHSAEGENVTSKCRIPQKYLSLIQRNALHKISSNLCFPSSLKVHLFANPAYEDNLYFFYKLGSLMVSWN